MTDQILCKMNRRKSQSKLRRQEEISYIDEDEVAELKEQLEENSELILELMNHINLLKDQNHQLNKEKIELIDKIKQLEIEIASTIIKKEPGKQPPAPPKLTAKPIPTIPPPPIRQSKPQERKQSEK